LEKLHKQRGGYYQSDSGLVAIVPLYKTHLDENNYFFDFLIDNLGATNRLVWEKAAEIAIIPEDFAKSLVQREWAKFANEAQVDKHNAAVSSNAKLPVSDVSKFDPTPAESMMENIESVEEVRAKLEKYEADKKTKKTGTLSAPTKPESTTKE
jgi:hypothetical protein